MFYLKQELSQTTTNLRIFSKIIGKKIQRKIRGKNRQKHKENV